MHIKGLTNPTGADYSNTLQTSTRRIISPVPIHSSTTDTNETRTIPIMTLASSSASNKQQQHFSGSESGGAQRSGSHPITINRLPRQASLTNSSMPAYSHTSNTGGVTHEKLFEHYTSRYATSHEVFRNGSAPPQSNPEDSHSSEGIPTEGMKALFNNEGKQT